MRNGATSAVNYPACSNEMDCVQVKELGRPAYLSRMRQRRVGVCAECEEAAKLGSTHTAPIFDVGQDELEDPDESASAQTSHIEEIHVDMKLEVTHPDGRVEILDNEMTNVDSTLIGRFGSFETKVIHPATVREVLERLQAGVYTVAKPGSLGRKIVSGGKALEVDAIKEDIEAAGTLYMPSRKDGEPIIFTKIDMNNELARSTMGFEIAYQAAGAMCQNSHRYAWAKMGPHPFGEAALALSNAIGEQLPSMMKETPRFSTLAGQFCTPEKVAEIFGHYTPEHVAVELKLVSAIWTGEALASGMKNESHPMWRASEGLNRLVSDELIDEDARRAAPRYVNAILEGNDCGETFLDHKSGTSLAGGRIERFIAEDINAAAARGEIRTPEEALALLTGPMGEKYENYLVNEELLERVLADKETAPGTREFFTGATIARTKDVLARVRKFCDYIDEEWKKFYEENPKRAMRNRFGAPVGLPEDMIDIHHYLPGGHLQESGWLSARDLPAGSKQTGALEIRLPVDENGRPDTDFRAWDQVRPVYTHRDPATIEGLGDMGYALSTAEQAWHVAYNHGLPRDNLYTAASLSWISGNIHGRSKDDFSGATTGVPGCPLLAGVELDFSRGFEAKGSMTARVQSLTTDLARSAAGSSVFRHGVQSQSEVNLSNWRMARLSDVLEPNEWGVKAYKRQVEASDKLSREWHESILNKINSGTLKHLELFPHRKDWMRPLVSASRGEAMRSFLTKPGSALLKGSLAETAHWKVIDAVKAPIAPWSVYHDPLFGLTDGANAYQQTKGRLSVNPHYFALAGGVIHGKNGITKRFVETFTTVGVVHPGIRGENVPRRLRFASKTLGESATEWGLVEPFGAAEGGRPRITELPTGLVPARSDDNGLVTEDSPRFAAHFEKNKVVWHTPEIFAKDYELGEIGVTARRGARSVNEYRAVQQGFLEGKMLKRAAATRHTQSGLVRALKVSGYVDPARALGTPTDYAARMPKTWQKHALENVGSIDTGLSSFPTAFKNHMSVGNGESPEYNGQWRQPISGNPDVARITSSDPRVHFIINDSAVEHSSIGVRGFNETVDRAKSGQDGKELKMDVIEHDEKFTKLYGREREANGHLAFGKLHDPKLPHSRFVRYALAQNGHLPGGLEKLPVKPVWEDGYPTKAAKWAEGARDLMKEGAFDVFDPTDPNQRIKMHDELESDIGRGEFEHHAKLTPFVASYHQNFAQHGAIISENASSEEVETLRAAVELERKRRGQG